MESELSQIADVINSATQEIFSTMIMLEVSGGTSSINNCDMDAALTAMLGFGGDIKGMVLIHCPEDVAIMITSSFLGMDVTEIDDDVRDAIGEIANMVAGMLKEHFQIEEVRVELATPTTIVGKSFRTSGLSGAKKVIVPFQCDHGSFWIELIYVAAK